MKYFYCNPTADVHLTALAITSLQNERAMEDVQLGWMLTGFLAGLLKRDQGEGMSETAVQVCTLCAFIACCHILTLYIHA